MLQVCHAPVSAVLCCGLGPTGPTGMGPKCEPHPGRIFDILLIKYSQAFLWQGLLYIQV